MLALAGSQAAAAQTRAPVPERLKPVTGGEATIPCPQYGPKFFRAPGSSVCVRLDGRVRGEMELRPRRSRLEPAGVSRVTAEARFEARSETGYGPLRAVVDSRKRRNPDEPLR